MPDMGFYDDIMRIVSLPPEKRQTVLFLATILPKIRKASGHPLKDPEQIIVTQNLQ